MKSLLEPWVLDSFRYPPTKYPADTAPRSKVKSRYACRSDGCEHGPSTGHKIRDGYCKKHQ